jgi:transposase
MINQINVLEFLKQFPDDDTCLEHLMYTRYRRSIDCPKCGRHGKFSRVRKIPAYQCAWCGHHIHPMAGTPFEKSRTPLQKWYYAMYLFTTSSRHVSAKELQRQLSVTYKTAWRINNEVRKYVGKMGYVKDNNFRTEKANEASVDNSETQNGDRGNEYYRSRVIR